MEEDFAAVYTHQATSTSCYPTMSPNTKRSIPTHNWNCPRPGTRNCATRKRC